MISMKNIFSICCLLLSALCTAQSNNDVLLQSNNGMWIALDDKPIGQSFNKATYDEVIVAWNTGSGFIKVATHKAVNNANDFAAAIGNGMTNELIKQNKEISKETLWQAACKTSTKEYFGIYALSSELLEAIGIIYKHKWDTKKNFGKTVSYKLSYYKSNRLVNEKTFSTVIKELFEVEKPIVIKKIEGDSTIGLHWAIPKSTTTGLIMGNIYKVDKKGNAEKIETMLSMKEQGNDTLHFNFQETVLPLQTHTYFLTPCNYAGFESTPSEPITLISTNFSNLPRAINLQANDTTNGIYLTFTPPPASPLIVGIVVERSRNKIDGFIPIDTIAATDNNYFDTKLLPNITYYYQLRTLGLRPSDVMPSAWANAQHVSKAKDDVNPPAGIKAAASNNGIEISWEPLLQIQNAGFRVYRNNGVSDKMEQIGLLITDNKFVDTTATDNRKQYTYYVTSLSYTNMESEPSKKVYAAPTHKTILPNAPTGLRAAAENGRVILTWGDEQANNPYIKGYTLYRKALKSGEVIKEKTYTAKELLQNGFVRLNTEIEKSNTYIDVQNVQTMPYQYYVTTIDVKNTESTAQNGIHVTVAPVALMPPGNFTARSISKGVVLSWDKSKQENITGYIIYKRESNIAKPTQLSKLDKNIETFTDKVAQKNKTYFYSIAAINGSANGEPSIETGVVHN
jgi:fibronectin type 3 domain-containing protein